MHTMQAISSDPKVELRTLIGIASQIARRGYGEPIVDLAMRRKGAPRPVARLIAASVVSCHATLVAAQAHARLENEAIAAARNADLRAAKASSVALSKMASFLVFIVGGIGGGAFLGWSIGFNLGIDEGFEWIVRTIERQLTG